MDVCSLLQEQIDQTGKDMYATLEYLNTKHDYFPFDGQAKVNSNDKDTFLPEDPAVFERTKIQMASNIVANSRKFDELIMTLPGLDRTEAQQVLRIEQLQEQLYAIEQRRLQAISLRDELHTDLEQVITRAASTIRSTR